MKILVYTYILLFFQRATSCETSYEDILKRLEERQKFLESKLEATENEITVLKAQGLPMHDTSSFARRMPPESGTGNAVGFLACVSVPDLQNLGPFHTIRYDHVITNTGGAYHSTTGVFTAPHKGLFVFAATAMVKGGKQQYLDLVKDGSVVNTFMAEARGDQYVHSTSVHWVLEMNQGSEVWIRTGHSGEIHGYCFTTFSGFMITQMV